MENFIKLFVSDSPRKRFRNKLRIIFIFIGGLATFVLSILLEEKMIWWSIIPFISLLVISLAEFVVADIITDRNYPKNTEKILDTLEAKISACEQDISNIIQNTINRLEINNKSIVSGTFHLKVDLYNELSAVETESALLQLIKYSGNYGGRKWRFTPATKGIIGRCLRTKKIEQINFLDINEFKDGMIKDFGFTSEELEKLTQTGRSYYAHPVEYETKLVGVLYLFSIEPNIFPKAIPHNFLMSSSATSIATYLKGADII